MIEKDTFFMSANMKPTAGLHQSGLPVKIELPVNHQTQITLLVFHVFISY